MATTFIKPDLPSISSKLSNKLALVTGGCSGIGLALVKLLHSSGCDVIVGDIHPPPEADPVFTSSTNSPGGVVYRSCDVSQWQSLRSLFATVTESFPGRKLDIVVANVGINEYGDQILQEQAEREVTEPDYRVLDVNVKGVSNTVTLALGYMRNLPRNDGKDTTGGNIIITASLAGYMGVAGMPLYSASKHAVWGLMRCLKLHTPDYNIAISAVCSGFTKTAIFQHLPGREGVDLEEVFAAISASGIGANSPETVALAIAYLASEGLGANGKALGVDTEQIVDMEAALFETRPEWARTTLSYLFPQQQQGHRLWDH